MSARVISSGWTVDDAEEDARRAAEARSLIDDDATREALRGLQGDTPIVPPPSGPTQAQVMDDVAAVVTPGRVVGHQSGRGVVLDATHEQRPVQMPERVAQVERQLAQPGGRYEVEAQTQRDVAGTPSAPRMPAAPTAAPAASSPARASRARALGTPDAPEFEDPAVPTAGERGTDAEIARWDSRIRAVQQELRSARDERTRAVLGNLLANLVRGAAQFFAGRPGGGDNRFFQGFDDEAFERRAGERLADRSREWDATDDMMLRAQELREEREQRSAQSSIARDRVDLQRQTLDLQRTREERRARLEDARLRLSQAQSQQERDAAMRDLLLDDPASAESARARDRFVVTVMGLPESVRRGYGANEAQIAARVRDMSARDIEALEGRLPRVSAGVRTSRAGSGGGAPRDGMPRAERRAALVQDGLRAGLTEPQMASMDDDDIARELALRQRGTAQISGARRDMLPGVTVDANLVDDVTARQHRAGLIQGRRAGDSLRVIRGVAERFGASAILSPEARAEVAPAIQRMLARVAEMRNTGIISPGELPGIEAFVPNPSSGEQITLGTVQARVDAFMADIESDVRATLEADGAGPEDIERALAYVRGGGGGSASRGAAAPPPSSRRYTVTMPDGRTRTGPLTDEQRRTLTAAGATVQEVR